MLEKIDMKVDCIIDESGVENLQKKLRSYNLGREFNYAVAVLKTLIVNGERNIKNTVSINIVPKVQYITPFVSKELAEKYLEELSTLDKLTMFLPIDEEGRVIVKQNNIENTMDEVFAKDRSSDIDKNLPIEKYLFLLADNWKDFWNTITEKQKDELLNHFGKNKELVMETIDEIYKRANIQ